MTREDIITNLRYWCNNIDKPCEECKIHDICVVRDHVQTFDSMDDKKLQEYYKLMYGSEVKVEKMEPVKVLEQITKITYPEKMKDVALYRCPKCKSYVAEWTEVCECGNRLDWGESEDLHVNNDKR